MLVGGRDVRDVTLASLHDTVGVVTQDAHMFHETIRANLRYARPDATDAELVDALRAAQILDLVAVAARRARHDWSATAATGSPAARSSGSRSPGCCSRRRTSSCSTRPPRTSTPSPRSLCSEH